MAPRRCLLIGLDGVRGDTITQMVNDGLLPNLARIRKKYRKCPGRCSRPHKGVWMTVPGWTAVMTGTQNPRRRVKGKLQHLIKDNTDKSIREAWQHIRKKGTIFHDLKNKAAGAFVKPYLHNYKEQIGILDEAPMQRSLTTAAKTCAKGSRMLIGECDLFLQRGGEFAFLYLDDADHAGHKFGFDGPKYRQRLRSIDKWLGDIIGRWVNSPGMLIGLVSDHGGHSKTHGNHRNDNQIPVWFSRDLPGGEHQTDVRWIIRKWFRVKGSKP